MRVRSGSAPIELVSTGVGAVTGTSCQLSMVEGRYLALRGDTLFLHGISAVESASAEPVTAQCAEIRAGRVILEGTAAMPPFIEWRRAEQGAVAVLFLLGVVVTAIALWVLGQRPVE